MRLTSLVLVTALTLAGAVAHAQSSTMGVMGSTGSTTGLNGSTMGAATNSGLGNNAGGIAAGANSAQSVRQQFYQHLAERIDLGADRHRRSLD
jgi:hypothetical protein